MILIPQSIQAQNTISIDQTLSTRLTIIGAPQLSINLTTERDIKKLSLYLQQFGIPTELLPTDMTALQFRALLQNVLHIYRLSGTNKSIKMLAKATGATNAEIIKNQFTLTHTRQSRHNNQHQHNKGTSNKHFAIKITIQGIPQQSQKTYTQTLTKLFYTFQPINIHLTAITFTQQQNEPITTP